MTRRKRPSLACVYFLTGMGILAFLVTNTVPKQNMYPEQVRQRRRRVVLMFPGDRYNFGDLLFEKVVRHLLERSGYLPTELISTGVVSEDMSMYGGNNHIVSFKTACEMSKAEVSVGTGPFDLVNLGGEAMGCSKDCAVSMFRGNKRTEAQGHPSTCGYLVAKRLLLPRDWGPGHAAHPVSIINSIGGRLDANACGEALRTADYASFRDNHFHQYPRQKVPFVLAPDCAVMVDMLFRDQITSVVGQGEVARIMDKSGGKYIAFQMKEDWPDPGHMAAVLQAIHATTGYMIVMFCAGTAPDHDSPAAYERLAAMIPDVPVHIFDTSNVWSVVALVSRAHLVVSTSLHVRIMAFIHLRPRITFCGKEKHRFFVSLFDSPGSTRCVDPGDRSPIAKVLQRAFEGNNGTAQAVQTCIQKYLANFDRWSSLLNH
jgi:hypothetical protein